MSICTIMNLLFHFTWAWIRSTNISKKGLSLMIIGDIANIRRNYCIYWDPCLKNGSNPTPSYIKQKSG